MTVEISAAELVANIRAKMDALPGDMAKAEQIVQNGAKNMQNGANTAGTGVGAKLGEGIKTGLSSFLGGGVGMLAGGAIAGGVALLTKEVIGTASELAELGRQSDRVGTSFTQLWGSEAPDAMAKLRDASQGTISDMDLMLAANKASMLGVGSGVGDLTKLMQVAQERGRAMGLTTAQAFSDIVTGIGRMSPMILDNLGIVMDAEATYKAYASSIGKSAETLTDVEKKQALVNRVTAEAGDVALDSAGKHEQLRAAKENLRTEIGGLINDFIEESGAVEALTGRLNDLRGALDMERTASASAAEMGASFNATLERSIDNAGMNERLYQRMVAGQRSLEAAFRDGRIGAEQYQVGINKLEDELRAATGQMSRAEIEAADLQESLVRNMAAGFNAARGFDAAGTAASRMAQQMASAAKVQYSPYGNQIYGSAQGSYEAVQSRVEYLQIENERRVLQRQMEAGRQEQLDSQRSYAAESVDIAQEQFDDIRHIIEGALSPTAVTAADLAATAAGTYVDKWDEYMRRVRMPESGLGADQIAEQERLFYSGQMLDQINWGAVVADVERRIQEEAGREAMIQEAMRQVAAAGIGASQSQVAAAMGITGYEPGTGEAEQMAKGLTAAGLGIKFTEEFEKEFQEQQQRWIDMGTLSVSWMATGMERGTTPQVTGLLVGLLAPRIAEVLMGARP